MLVVIYINKIDDARDIHLVSETAAFLLPIIPNINVSDKFVSQTRIPLLGNGDNLSFS
jgi:hypothetical protein